MADSTIARESPRTRWWSEHRLGGRAEAAAIGILLLVLAAVLSHYLLVKATTPEVVSTKYVQSLSTGDVNGAWDAMTVAPPAASVEGGLLDKTAFGSFLRLPPNQFRAAEIQSRVGTQTSDRATVVVTYRDGQYPKTRSLTLVRSASEHRYAFYPLWRVQVVPAIISTSVPSTAGALSIDGRKIDGASSTIAVFPGTHVAEVAPSAVFLATATKISTTDPKAPAKASFEFKLTDQAIASATTAVRQKITTCGSSPLLNPPGCPQGVTGAADGPVRWELIGDPTSNMSYTVTSDGQISGAGYFQMAVTYTQSGRSGTIHKPVGSPYLAQVAADAGGFSVTNFSLPASPAPAVRPAAADDAAFKKILKSELDRCLGATTPSPRDCPQSVFALQTSNLTWKADADPMADATITFDATRSLFKVTGTYAMTATYDYTYDLQPTRHTSKSTTGEYSADFFWDGSKPVFVTFE